MAMTAVESKRLWHERGGCTNRHLGDMLSSNNAHYQHSTSDEPEKPRGAAKMVYPHIMPSATPGNRHDASEVARSGLPTLGDPMSLGPRPLGLPWQMHKLCKPTRHDTTRSTQLI